MAHFEWIDTLYCSAIVVDANCHDARLKVVLFDRNENRNGGGVEVIDSTVRSDDNLCTLSLSLRKKLAGSLPLRKCMYSHRDCVCAWTISLSLSSSKTVSHSSMNVCVDPITSRNRIKTFIFVHLCHLVLDETFVCGFWLNESGYVQTA